jgi:hypothetical protein
MNFALGEVSRVSASIRPPALTTDKVLASEIRSRLATLKPEDRDKALADDVVMSAAANGPAFLSGLSPAQLDMQIATWSRAKYPAESDRLRRIGKALDAARRAGAEGDGFFRDLVKTMLTPSVHTAIRTKAALEAATAEAVAE